MKLKTILASGIGAIALTVALAGCSGTPESGKQSEAPTAASQTEKTTESSKPTQSPSASATQKSEASTGDATVMQPGERTTGTGTVPFTNSDKKTANFSHKVASIDKAPESDVTALLEKLPKLKGMDVYYVNVASHYVDGENLEFSSLGSSFNPVDAEGQRVQNIILVGWDACKTNSIPKPGNDKATEIKNCFAAAVPAGQPAPAGVAYAPNNSPYAKSGGKPALFLLG